MGAASRRRRSPLAGKLVAAWAVAGWMLAGLAAAEAARAHGRTGVVVLAYHHLGQPARGSTVDPAAFEEQMRWLVEEGYRPVPLPELLEYVRGRRELPSRAVAITFDDGYESAYSVALPALERHGLRAVAFPTTRWLQERAPWLPHFTADQARAMGATGRVELGSHSHDLHYYPEGDRRPAMEVLPARTVLDDLRRSRQVIAAISGAPPLAFAYPYGWQSPRSRKLVAMAGFGMAFALGGGAVCPGADPLRLPRVAITAEMDLAAFARQVVRAARCPG